MTFAAKWFVKKTVALPNASDDEPPDEVGVLKPWNPTPAIFTRIPNDLANKILDIIDRGLWDDNGKPTGDLYTSARQGKANKRWAGNVVVELVEKASEEECKPEDAQTVIDTWIKSGLLIEISETTSTSKGKKRKTLRVDDTKRPGVLVSEDTL